MDKKAKDILIKTYWSANGWKREAETAPADFEYAKSMGVMFDSVDLTKEELLSRLSEISHSIPVKKVTDAFLSSLTNKRLDLRSGLGSYANAKRLLTKPDYPDYYFDYGKNLNLNVLNFERIKFGGVRHSYALYNWLDLELLSKEDITLPTQEDIDKFKSIINIIYSSQSGDTPGTLRDNLQRALKFSKNEAHNIMEILACAEIIEALNYDRKEPGKHDWTFMTYWRGEDAYNKQMTKFYFENYGII